jgi:hypothetical protein
VPEYEGVNPLTARLGCLPVTADEYDPPLKACLDNVNLSFPMEFVQNRIRARPPEKPSPIPLLPVPPPASVKITSIDDEIGEDLEEENPPMIPAPRNADPSTAPRESVKYAEWENDSRTIHNFK